jgi:hypothetical protein
MTYLMVICGLMELEYGDISLPERRLAQMTGTMAKQCIVIYLKVLTLILMGTFTIGTYNSHGLGDGRIQYIDKLLRDHDIVFIQEHWQFQGQLHVFEDKLDSVKAHGCSGMPSDQLLLGRPYGGCAIIWKRSMIGQITPVDTSSRRICAVIMKTEHTTLLLCNVYMPCDRGDHGSNYVEYIEVLEEISELGHTNDVDNIIIGGDLNTDLSRLQSPHTGALKLFSSNESLKFGLTHECSRVNYTYESKVTGDRSTLDHFLVTENLYQYITNYQSIHAGDNLSDHSVLSMSLDIPITHYMEETKNLSGKVSWQKASNHDICNYQETLDSLLSSIDVPWGALECCDYLCVDHNMEIENFHDKIIDACLEASFTCIPVSKHANEQSKPIPGWHDYVERYKEQAIFWHNIWKDSNSPRSGILADIRKKTRAKYHYAIRSLRKNEDNYISNKIANSLLEKNDAQFWQEINRLKGKKPSTPCNIDNAVGKESIGKLFANKYEQLYNSVSYRKEDMDNLMGDITNIIVSSCCAGKCQDCINRVTVFDIEQGVSKLKLGKTDGSTGHCTNHLIHGTPKLHVCLSLLMSSMLSHGFAPTGFRLSTIVPIPKDKRKSVRVSDNYRGIALSSAIGKLFDWVILQRSKSVFKTLDLQFGYKQGHSTSQCTFVVNETIQYYLNRGSSVHTLLLDASKAFDCVNYIKLFYALLDKGICPIVARFLAQLYTLQKIRIKWSDYYSEPCNVSNGVKQGGVLSPILFCVYTDELLLRLQKSGFGCYIGHIFFGAFAYADDVILLAPTKTSLYKMIDIANAYSKEFDITFNPGKTKYLIYNNQNAGQGNIKFGNKILQDLPHAKHLGNVIGPEVKDGNIKKCIIDLLVRTNVTLAQFKQASSMARYKLFKSFCMSVYGSSLWDFSEKMVESFYVAWRKCVRKVWRLPPRTHNSLLSLICEDEPIDVQLHRRFFKFFRCAMKSCNYNVSICARLVVEGSRSATCNSLNFICRKYNVCKYVINKTSLKTIANCNREGASEITASVIRELIEERDNKISRQLNFTVAEIEDFITDVCTY